MILTIQQRINFLREQSGMTQKELAARLGVTRSSVNAWEMGISVPTTERVVDIALLFKTSADYLLGLSAEKVLQMDSLDMNQQELIYRFVQYYDKVNVRVRQLETKLQKKK